MYTEIEASVARPPIPSRAAGRRLGPNEARYEARDGIGQTVHSLRPALASSPALHIPTAPARRGSGFPRRVQPEPSRQHRPCLPDCKARSIVLQSMAASGMASSGIGSGSRGSGGCCVVRGTWQRAKGTHTHTTLVPGIKTSHPPSLARKEDLSTSHHSPTHKFA
jgi:hypothetical protein